MLKDRRIRRILRGAVLLFGIAHLIAAALEGFRDMFPVAVGGMSLFVFATNFCTQCLLLSFVKRLFRRERVIETERL